MDIRVNGTKYTIHETIGVGGYSSVYRISDPLRRFYALKKINIQSINERDLVIGFRREVAILKKLRDEPRVIKYITSEVESSTVLLVLELGDVDLDTIIHSGSGLELYAVRHYSREIFKCVQAIHRYGVIHSDLKPANFISIRGSLKLIDFGISDVPKDDTVNVYRPHAIGTLSYMAPETFCEHTLSVKPNKHSVSPSSDIWSCGCIMYEMIYRKKVFDSHKDKFKAILDRNVEIYFSDNGQCFVVPWCFKNLIKQCLTRDISQRTTVDDALNSLALTETYVSIHDVRSIIERAFRLGIEKDKSSREDLSSFITKELLILT